jgi:type II secretion system protein I
MKRERGCSGRAAGFSLLEVILALAILAGAIAILSESARHALQNAGIARDLARAQLLCESKLSEIVAGMTSTDSTTGTFDTGVDPNDPDWQYSIESEPVGDDNTLMAVTVTVTRDLPPESQPVQFTLVRWVASPTASSSDTSDDTSAQGGTSGTGATSGGGP